LAFEAKHLIALQCGNTDCGHIYAAEPQSRRPAQRHLDPAGECERYAQRDPGLVSFLVRARFLRRSSRVLDFGAGVGHLAMAVKNALPEAEVICVEENSSARDWLKHNGLSVVTELEGCTGRFDAIYMIDTLAFVEDPIASLKALNELLTPGGQVFLTVPGGETSTGWRVLGSYETPEHIQFFTEKSLRRALLAGGFEAPLFRTIRHLYHMRGGFVPINIAKDLARVLRSRVRGHHQLVTFVRRGDKTQ
jgi:SAM-dependent methyltransferase